MELSLFQKLLAVLFIVIYMFAVGLITKKGAVVNTLTNEKLIYKALLLNFVLIPLLGIGLTQILDLSMDAKIGLTLLSISPGGLFSLNFVRVSAGNIKLAIALLCLFSLLSIVATPLAAYFFIGKMGASSFYSWTVFQLFLLILVPLYCGRFLAQFIPNPVFVAKILGITSILLFIGFNLVTSSIKSYALHSIETNAIGIILLLVLISWGLGWILGGDKLENKKVLAISTSMRNVAFCYPFALNEFVNTKVFVPIIAFSTISILMNMGFVVVLKLREKNGRTG